MFNWKLNKCGISGLLYNLLYVDIVDCYISMNYEDIYVYI